MNYYGAFYRSELYGLLQRINTYLMRWARKKFKRLSVYKRLQGVVGKACQTTAGPIRALGVDARVLMDWMRRAE